MKMKHNQQNQEALLARLKATNEDVQDARNNTDKGFSFTRRTIALFSVFCIIGIPLIAGFIFPSMPITYAHVQEGAGFLFFTRPDLLTWETAYGITILPFHTHFVSAIGGMYFGNRVIR